MGRTYVRLAVAVTAAALVTAASGQAAGQAAGPPTGTEALGLDGVVISEFAPSGESGPTDEFLEFYNTADERVDLGGWELRACAPGLSLLVLDFAPGTTIGAGDRFWVSHRDHPQFPPVPPDVRYDGDIPEDGGWLLDDPLGGSVGIGLQPGLPCTQGDPAPQCDWAAGESVNGNVPGWSHDDEGYTCEPRTPGF